MDEHFSGHAAFVATLHPDDVERVAAERHVISCGMCREALDEAKSLLTLVKRALLLPLPEDGAP